MENPRYSGSFGYLSLLKRAYFPSTWYSRNLTVGSNPTRILPNNPRRLMLLLCNLGSGVIRVGFSPNDIVEGGLLLSGNGSNVILTIDEDGELVGAEIWAISHTGENQNVYYVEVVGVEE